MAPSPPPGGAYSISVRVGDGGAMPLTYNQFFNPNQASGYALVRQPAPDAGSLRRAYPAGRPPRTA